MAVLVRNHHGTRETSNWNNHTLYYLGNDSKSFNFFTDVILMVDPIITPYPYVIPTTPYPYVIPTNFYVIRNLQRSDLNTRFQVIGESAPICRFENELFEIVDPKEGLYYFYKVNTSLRYTEYKEPVRVRRGDIVRVYSEYWKHGQLISRSNVYVWLTESKPFLTEATQS